MTAVPTFKKPFGKKGIRVWAVVWIALLLVMTLSGCSMIRFLLEPLPPPPTLPSIELIPTTRASSRATPTPTSTTSRTSPSSSSATTAVPVMTTTLASGTASPSSRPADTFETRVIGLILKGLDQASREIVLDDALLGRTVYENDVDDTIEQVFDLFQQVYYNYPQYYFLSGQASAGYVLNRGTTTRLQSITLKPGFIDSAATLPATAIRERQKTLEAAAEAMAADAKKSGESKTVQLRYVHDTLIRLIRYDLEAAEESTMNRERSNAASAILDRLALCQGYSAAFQLVSQKLGVEVLMATGTAEGVNHAWNLVKLDDQYYHVDLTFDDPTPDGGSDAPVDHVHFFRSDSLMRQTHVWKATDYPAAATDGAFFYRENKLLSATRSDLQKRINTFVAALPKKIDKPGQLEILYTGKDIPTVSALEKMLTEALNKAGRTGQILYTRRVDKSVAVIEFLPPG